MLHAHTHKIQADISYSLNGQFSVKKKYFTHNNSKVGNICTSKQQKIIRASIKNIDLHLLFGGETKKLQQFDWFDRIVNIVSEEWMKKVIKLFQVSLATIEILDTINNNF